MRTRFNAALSFVVVIAMIAFASIANAQEEDSAGTMPAEPNWFTPPPGYAPSTPPRSIYSMTIDLRTQHAYVYRDGARIGETRVSTGKPGYRTPTGVFSVLEKQRIHHSNRYDNAPMPFMQRLTWYGVALHAGHVPNYPASHGCIRMPRKFAEWLYSEPTMGMTVTITEGEPRAIARETSTITTTPVVDTGDTSQ